jgi:putative ABC transport system permease protein
MTLRDWRAGELRFLMVALLLSVAALSAVNFFIARMEAGFARDAQQMLAADLVLSADTPLSDDWRAEARQRGLHSADTVALLTMASVDEEGKPEAEQPSSMVALKSVSDAYPLRGHLKLRVAGADVIADGAPEPGTVWVDAALMASGHLKIGSALHIGERSFAVAGVIAAEPDVGAAFAVLAPRVMISAADMPSTQLLQQHARATYRWLLAGDAQQIAVFEQWVKQRMAAQPGQAVEVSTAATSRDSSREMIDQARRFLSMVSLLTALLAGVAVAMASRRFMQRHVNASAMLRCLGLTQAQLTQVYLLEFLLVGLLASAVGVVLGYGAHFALAEWLGKLMASDLPQAGWLPALQGLATGLVLLMGFALPPVLQLRNVSQLALLRREQGSAEPRAWIAYGVALLAFIGLLIWQTGDVVLGLGLALGFVLGGVLFGAVAWLALMGLRRARGLFGSAAWRFAVTDMLRRPVAAVTQVVALALGLTALLLLTVVRGDLLAAWRHDTPAGAPNHVVINIQPDQAGALEQRLAPFGAPALHPQTRARITQVNGKPAGEGAAKDDPRVRDLIEHEVEIGQAEALPKSDTLVSGIWYAAVPQPGAATHASVSLPQVSVAEVVADTLHLKLGDRLSFDISGQSLEARVTSVRKVNWRAHEVSDLLLLSPQAMREQPFTLAVAVHVPASDMLFATQLTRDFPNLTVFNLSALIQHLQAMFDQLTAAGEFLFAFTLTAGVLVLYAALSGSQDERIRQSALLRALGATRQQLVRAQWIEHVLTGALSGVLAAAGATLSSWAMARFVLHLQWNWSPLLWLCGLAAGALCAASAGWLALRHVLNQPPLLSLRQQ